MPTARELLEQADALMRRKREPPPVPEHGGDISTQAESTLTISEAPSIAELESATAAAAVFAPAVLRSPRTIQREPIAPSMVREMLADEPAPLPLAMPAAGTQDADFPVLTDAVEVDRLLDLEADVEVPVLVDTVDAIGDEPILEDLDEPSVWSPTFGAAPTVSAEPRGAVAPEAESTTEVVSPDPLGLDRPPAGFEPPPSVQWEEAETPSLAGPAPIAHPVEAVRVAPELVDAAIAPAAAPMFVPAVAPAVAPAPVLDDARVREIAEEIGMQVLQRIDIFTDTELRAKLGERLQPVVERVSAELVAAINQHVGELLRVYVAEAIEREIDRWRDRQP